MARYYRRKRYSEKPDTGSWLTTYGDMVTLLLTFFVLLFSFSSVDASRFQAVLYSLQDALGFLEAGTTLKIDYEPTSMPGEKDKEWEEEQRRLEELLAKLEAIIEEQGLEERILLSLEERGLVVRFLDSVLFDLGSAELREDALEVLANVAAALQDLPNHIRAEGHTDDLPINTYRYPSNWELSTARATSVMRALLDSYPFSPAQLGVAGYGEYRPIAPNQPRGQPLNRRVDLVVLRETLNIREPSAQLSEEESKWE